MWLQMLFLGDTLLSSLRAQILGFDNIRKLYVSDDYFSPIYASCGHKTQDGLYIAKGYFFQGGKALDTPRIL